MTQETQSKQSEKQTITIELTWRSVGYVVAVALIIFVLGMQTYPLLPYASIFAFILLGIGIALLAVTAPLLRKKK